MKSFRLLAFLLFGFILLSLGANAQAVQSVLRFGPDANQKPGWILTEPTYNNQYYITATTAGVSATAPAHAYGYCLDPGVNGDLFSKINGIGASVSLTQTITDGSGVSHNATCHILPTDGSTKYIAIWSNTNANTAWIHWWANQ